MLPTDWPDKFNAELTQAENARSRGLEGQARVCARRAAGVVLREYARRHEGKLMNLSAMDLIRHFSEDSSLPDSSRQILNILTLRVLPGGVFPINEDPVSLVRSLPAVLGLD